MFIACNEKEVCLLPFHESNIFQVKFQDVSFSLMNTSATFSSLLYALGSRTICTMSRGFCPLASWRLLPKKEHKVRLFIFWGLCLWGHCGLAVFWPKIITSIMRPSPNSSLSGFQELLSLFNLSDLEGNHALGYWTMLSYLLSTLFQVVPSLKLVLFECTIWFLLGLWLTQLCLGFFLETWLLGSDGGLSGMKK